MVRFQRLPKLVAFALFALLCTSPVFSQAGFQFGQNKVHYKKFDWAVFRTEHFDVHYYAEMKESAHDAARMAERGYEYLTKTLDHEIKERIPLILYASINDFQQTNTVQGFLGNGTRGVTESLKKRVVLPMTGSYREFNHVLVHELVHAFQYDIMFGKQSNSRFNPPLWFVEGMAEYLSIGLTNTTRMWVRDGFEHDHLLTVDKLNSTFDIRVYRLGESLWHYIGENYGKPMVGVIFKEAARTGNVEMALKKNLGKKPKELTEAWHKYAKTVVLPNDSTLSSPDELAELLTSQKSFYHRMNITPAVSPDGRHIAYINNQDLNEGVYMLSKNDDGTVTNKELVSGGTSKRFEALGFFETSIGWSQDGNRIAFVSKSGKDDAIYIMNPHTRKQLYQFAFEELNGLLSPSFSPDGKRIAFAGMTGGVSDLYILDLQTEALTQLTNDRFTVYHPQWSPDGSSIAYATDKGEGTDEDRLLFGDYDLAIYDLESNQVKLLPTLSGNVHSPQWSPDMQQLAFVSEHRGIPNIYLMNIASGNVRPVTNFKNGVSGITATTPAISWSLNGSTLAFSFFKKNSWQIYSMDMEKVLEEQETTTPQQHIASLTSIMVSDDDSSETTYVVKDTMWVPAMPDQTTLYSKYELASEDSVEARNYSKNFKLDAVGVGGGYDTFWGASGGASFLFSDMLGNNNLFLSTALRFSDPRFMDASLTYFNQGGRLNWGVQVYQQSYNYLTGASFFTLNSIRNTYRGFNTLVSYPFSRFARFEINAGVTRIDQDFVVEDFSSGRLDREDFDLGKFDFAQAGAALVFDNTTYGYIGPLSGSRSRFQVQTVTGDLKFNEVLVDYRRYFKTSSRSTIAWRLIGASNFGENPQIYSIGGPFTYRGSDYNELFGNNFLVQNLEFRFPALPFLPAQYDFFSAAAFMDAAAAWGTDIPGFSSETFQPFTNSAENGFRLNDLNAAFGVGARFSLGYFLLKYDLAWPTDLQSVSSPVSRFSIGTFF